MRALDTNVLIRFFMDDDSDQAAVARHLLEASQDQREPLLIVSARSLRVSVGASQASFRLARKEVAEILQKVLVREVFVFEREQAIKSALHRYQKGRADFPDYLIGEIAAASGCRDTVTFDRALKGSPGFTIL